MCISDGSEDVCSSDLTEAFKTPDNTVVFVTESDRDMIRKDQADCMGCLSHCGFSAWKDHDDYSTGYLADPRSFCIQKTLQDIAHRSEEHTSELQSLMRISYAVFCLKKKKNIKTIHTIKQIRDNKEIP